jgi:hypothetical protein
MTPSLVTSPEGRPPSALAAAALILLALMSLPPLVLTTGAVTFFPPYPTALQTWAAEATVLALMAGAITWRAALDHRSGLGTGAHTLLCAVLAAALTGLHWLIVDRDPPRADWQRDLYRTILAHTADVPHVYRPLPYGFVRLLEGLTHDWRFACLAYRWFFTFWFVWGAYRFARLYHPPRRALLTLLPLAALYPLSILYYFGQLTDPLSHALFILALVWLLEDRPVLLAGALALGVLAKETVLIVVPVYLACHRRQGWRALGKTAALGAAGLAAFLAARSLAWRPGYEAINGTDGLMIGTNLGLGTPIAYTSVPLYQNYLHPLLFVGLFLPGIVAGWRRIDPLLRVLSLTLTPLLLASNLCFGWLYESRNYMPLVPVLATMAVYRLPRHNERHRVGA